VNACQVGDTARPPPRVGFPTHAIRSARRSSYAARTSLVAPASKRVSSITCVQLENDNVMNFIPTMLSPSPPQILGPSGSRLAAAISTDQSSGPTMSFASRRRDDVKQVVFCRFTENFGLNMLNTSSIFSVFSHIAFLSRLLAGRHAVARLQDSCNLNGCRYRTILHWENDGRRRTQLHCFVACRWLLLRARNRRSGVNRYPQCRLR